MGTQMKDEANSQFPRCCVDVISFSERQRPLSDFFSATHPISGETDQDFHNPVEGAVRTEAGKMHPNLGWSTQ
jgi:hypothetical protein